MAINCIPLELPGFGIQIVESHEERITIMAEANTRRAACPHCHAISGHIHSYYTRSPQDLPSSGKTVQLVLRVRRFRCQNPACSAVTFSERLPGVMAPSAQRTVRLRSSLSAIGFALGGKAGARLSKRFGMAASPSTILRLVRQCAVSNIATPRVLGIDDFALRKGQVYGTLFVDGETHRPVDVVRERTSEVVATWLKAHPGVEVITRDRSVEYARGATEGAPQALQVADRWHLLTNLREALERLLNRLHTELVHLPLSPDTPPAVAIQRPALDSQGPSRRAALQVNRARRFARYQAVRTLLAQGVPQLQISQQLGLTRRTVRTFAQADTFPERAMPPPVKSILDPYIPYLQQRLSEGCSNSSQLWREVQALGFSGSRALVASWVCYYRTSSSPSTPHRYLVDPAGGVLKPPPRPALLPAPRQLVWCLLRSTDELTPEEKAIFSRIRLHPQVDRAYRLSRQFQRMIRDHCADDLTAWLQACLDSAIPELQTFATSLQRDESAIRLALSTAWNNGITEGHVNRLKMIKRTMYGRANFDLLRLRVLAAA